ncbi:Retrovirus-related Pol polyprotein, partial [Mucuna pruriens]
MPFGLTNGPSTFMRLMSHVLRILIVKKETLFANLENCEFCSIEVNNLDLIVRSYGVKVDEEKVKAIQDWPTSKTVREVRSVHVLAIHFVSPLNEIMKKFVGFKWEEIKERGFQALKGRLSQDLILALPNFLECDASSIGKMNVVMKKILILVKQRWRHALIAMLETKISWT